MKGCTGKRVLAIVLFQTILLSSYAYANTENSTSAMLSTKAGCMGCHQGETITLPSKKMTDKNTNRINQTNQKNKNIKHKFLAKVTTRPDSA